jgi:hypothetical protein
LGVSDENLRRRSPDISMTRLYDISGKDRSLNRKAKTRDKLVYTLSALTPPYFIASISET